MLATDSRQDVTLEPFVTENSVKRTGAPYLLNDAMW